VPLVQDADVEGDEAFVVGLNSGTNGGVAGVNQRIVVTIRDDDLPAP
jgi:hypothetical protein